jgi:DNA polymerase (family 10)
MAEQNQKVSEALAQMGRFLAMKKEPWKPRAYEKAAEIITSLEEDVEDIWKRGGIKALKEIPGVGQSIAETIEEFLKTGKIKKLASLEKRTPVNLSELSKVEGLGPQKVQKLYQELGITNLKELEKAAKSGKIAPIAGFGKKTEENILRGIEFAKTAGSRYVLGFAMPKVKLVIERLKKIKGAEEVMVAGSARRRKETIGDIDILAIADEPTEIMDAFVKMPEVVNVTAKGDTKASARFYWGMDVDLRVVPKESYGAALLYFTGSKDHNVVLRSLALKKGYTLNEYGLYEFKRAKKGKMVAGRTEEEVYKALGMQFIPPEMRENTGEVELALAHKIPELINYDELQGDLQVQTDWTDGSASIEEMAKAALKHGLKYIAITDHTKNLAMTGGLDEKKLLKQMDEIDKLNKKFAGKIKILKGTECDILKDGSLDIADEVLAKLDVVGVSVHSHFRLPQKEQTARVIRAMENPNADILFHPTDRIIQKREPIDVDMDAVISAAKRTKTVLEIDAYPDRTDLKDEYIRKCVEVGVKMSIDSDAHNPQHFAFLEYGISQARRGFTEKKDIINAHSWEKMLSMLK